MKEEITLFLHVTDGGAVYYTDNHDFFEATVVIRVDDGLEIVCFDTEEGDKI